MFNFRIKHFCLSISCKNVSFIHESVRLLHMNVSDEHVGSVQQRIRSQNWRMQLLSSANKLGLIQRLVDHFSFQLA